MKNSPRKYVLAIVCIAAIGLSSIAWTGNQQTKTYQSQQDTVPRKQKSASPSKTYKKDFDKQLDEIDKAMKDVQHLPDIDFGKMQADIQSSMKQLEEQMAKQKIDMDKMQKDLNESLSKINMDKMQIDLRNSLKEIEKLDVEKMQKDLKESLANLDPDSYRDKMKGDIERSLKELDKIDLSKMQDEIKASMENLKVNINADEIRKNVMESIDKIDFGKMKKEMEKASEEMKKSKGNMKLDMNKIHDDLQKAKDELKGYQEMVYDMEKDGLLKTSGDYTIQYENGDLIVNGKKQPAEVVNKYKKYFSKDGTTIRKEKGEMNINIQ